MDAHDYHALASAKEYGSTRRHTAIVTMFRHKVFRMAGLRTIAEPLNSLPGSNERPADIYYETRDVHGMPTTWTAYDVTVRSAYAKLCLSSIVHEGGMHAARGEAQKIAKYAERCQAQTLPIQFVRQQESRWRLTRTAQRVRKL